MSDTRPRRNLPSDAERWGRSVESDLDAALEKISSLEQVIGNLSRAITGSLNGLNTIINLDSLDEGENPFYRASPMGSEVLGEGSLAMSPAAAITFDLEWGFRPENAPNVTGIGGRYGIAIGTGAHGAIVRDQGGIGIGWVEAGGFGDVAIGYNATTSTGATDN